MIPMVANISVATDDLDRPVRLWLPLFLVWIVLAVLAVLLSPLILVGCLILRLNPLLTVWRVSVVLAALSGTNIEVHTPDSHTDVVVRVI